jgi:hypothetical protein
MNHQQAEKWKKIRERGQFKYVLIHGFLYWAVPLTIVTTLSQILVGEFQWGWIWVRLIVFSMIGFISGNVRWSTNERKFQQ